MEINQKSYGDQSKDASADINRNFDNHFGNTRGGRQASVQQLRQAPVHMPSKRRAKMGA